MFVVITISVVLLLVIVGLLFLRLRLIIDSENEEAELRLIPIAKAKLVVSEEGVIGYRWRVPFYGKEGQLFPPLADSQQEEGEKKIETEKTIKETDGKAKKNGSRMSPRQLIRLTRALLPSFKVNRLRFHLNTGDVIWNAWLYPVFYSWYSQGKDVAIHFHGPSSLVLDIENSLHRIIGALLHEYLKPNISWNPTSKT